MMLAKFKKNKKNKKKKIRIYIIETRVFYPLTLLFKGPKALLQEEQYATSMSLTQTGLGKRNVNRSSYVCI